MVFVFGRKTFIPLLSMKFDRFACDGEIDLRETKRKIRRLSRRLVRRQASWFAIDDTNIKWHEMSCMPLAELHAAAINWMNLIP